MVRSEHRHERQHLGAIDLNQRLGNIELSVITQHWVAKILKVRLLDSQLFDKVNDLTQERLRAYVPSDQKLKLLEQVVGLQSSTKVLQLLPTQNLSLEPVFIPGVVRKLYGVDEGHIEPKQLEGKDSGFVPHIAEYGVTLDAKDLPEHYIKASTLETPVVAVYRASTKGSEKLTSSCFCCTHPGLSFLQLDTRPRSGSARSE